MIGLPKIPSTPLEVKEIYVATIYPKEGIVFQIGVTDADGKYFGHGAPKWIDVEDIDFEEIGEVLPTAKTKKQLTDLGWHVVIDND